MTLSESPPRRGADTRERLLDLAEAAILEKGFASTSIDELIAGAGITKSGFFYHFKDKGELAKALLQRYLNRENAMFDALFARADELNEDPLHGFLIWLTLHAEMMNDLPTAHPGCLVASYCYQDQLFNREVRAEGSTALAVPFCASAAAHCRALSATHRYRAGNARGYAFDCNGWRNHPVQGDGR